MGNAAATLSSPAARCQRRVRLLFLLMRGGLLYGYALLGPPLQLFGTAVRGTGTKVHRQGCDRGEPIRNCWKDGVGFNFLLPEVCRVAGAM